MFIETLFHIVPIKSGDNMKSRDYEGHNYLHRRQS
jgi:hypothetical protein